MRYKFLKTVLAILVMAMFAKIYQHNCLIRMSYQKQRLQQKELEIIKKKSDLLTQLFQATDRDGVKNWARTECHMDTVAFSQVISVTGR